MRGMMEYCRAAPRPTRAGFFATSLKSCRHGAGLGSDTACPDSSFDLMGAYRWAASESTAGYVTGPYRDACMPCPQH